MAVIQAEGIRKVYGTGDVRVHALRDCSIRISQGERLAITGDSGAGKSTLLHILSGLDAPTEGRILYDGQDIAVMEEKELAAFRRKHIGFVFQAYNLVPELTAWENILLPHLLDGTPADEAYLKEICGSLGIGDRLRHMPYALSGGQQQKAAIARALCHKPQVVFCDEPTGNLDSESAGDVIRLLNELSDTLGFSLVIVTHNLEIAGRYERRVTVRDGKVSGDLT